MFREYLHVERFGNDEVQGIELGECYVFPKLDGTNASVWWTPEGIQAGGRKRHLSVGEDNAGFYAWVLSGENGLADFFVGRDSNKVLRLYGEWLVPHSLRTYRDEAWRKFYVFDVWSDAAQRYLSYDEYQPLIEESGIDYVPPLCVMRSTTHDALLVELENNGFLIKEGRGSGEGIVIKNYLFQNRFGRTVWAKMVTNEFKEKHVKAMGPTIKNMKELPEQSICDKYVTKHLVDKVYAKIVNENGGWNSKYIPRLLQTVFYDLINEEAWNFVKEMKMPTVNFRALNQLTVMTIKQLRPELF